MLISKRPHNFATALLLAVLLAFASLAAAAADSDPASAPASYAAHPEVPGFIAEMVEEYNFSAAQLQKLFASVKRNDFSLKTIAKPAEKTLTWNQYRHRLVDAQRIRDGLLFWDDYSESIDRAVQRFGVPPEILVAIIGVETRYGRIRGRHRVIDTLATLGFDYPRRSSFFRSELKHFLVLSRKQGFNPLDLTGSYAGAMGYGQFMPSSYLRFGIDFDGDKVADLLDNPLDAIGSVANYLAENGWRPGYPVAIKAAKDGAADEKYLKAERRAKYTVNQLAAAGYRGVVDLPGDWRALIVALGEEGVQSYWLGLHNFTVVMSYNPRHFYAMAVFLLANELVLARELSPPEK